MSSFIYIYFNINTLYVITCAHTHTQHTRTHSLSLYPNTSLFSKQTAETQDFLCVCVCAVTHRVLMLKRMKINERIHITEHVNRGRRGWFSWWIKGTVSGCSSQRTQAGVRIVSYSFRTSTVSFCLPLILNLVLLYLFYLTSFLFHMSLFDPFTSQQCTCCLSVLCLHYHLNVL